MTTRVTTVRLDARQMEDVETCARVEGITVSEFIRRAVGNRVVDLHQSPTFRAGLVALIARDQARLAALGGDS